MTPEQERDRALQAKRWLDDPLFRAAMDDVRAQLRSARLGAGNPTDTALHSKLVLMEQMAERFFGYFEQLAQTGQFAQLHLDELENRRRGFKDRLAAYASWGRNGL